MQAIIDFAVENPILASSLLSSGTCLAGIAIGKYIERGTEDLKQSKKVAECTLTSLYAKVVRWEVDQEGVKPLFAADATRHPDYPIDVDVFDETVYTAVSVYDKSTSGHEYIFRGSGVVDLLCVYPWRDKLHFTDEASAGVPQRIRQAFSHQSSNSFVMVTHAYNGLQVDQEDFAVRMPTDCKEGRLVVDLSSVPHILEAMTEAPRAELRSDHLGNRPSLQVTEYRRGIYAIEAHNLRKDDVLFLDFTVDWEQICQHSRSTSLATDQ